MDVARRETHCRTLILEHAQALYGSQYPLNHIWSVIIGKTNEQRYKAHAIVYEQPGSVGSWKVLMTGEKSRDDARALESLLEALKVEVGARVGG